MGKEFMMVIVVWIIGMTILMSGCDYIYMDKHIDLPPNQKLVNVTWQNSAFWYVTRPMRSNEIAEIYTIKNTDSKKDAIILVEHVDHE